MRRVFFDTSAYIALTDTSDQFHAPAVVVARAIAARRLPRVATNYVLAETYTRLRRKLNHAAAVRFGESVQRDVAIGNLEIIYVDAALDRIAWRVFRKHADQTFSFVDCSSFAWLQGQRDVEVFAFDEHFVWMGFSLFRV